MLIVKIKYICKLCGGNKFYISPIDEITKFGDKVSSLNIFTVQCKECRNKYRLKVTLE